MNDLTLLYYTANRITPHFAGAVRRSLADATTEPIVVVSQNGSTHGDLAINADFAHRVQRLIPVDAPPSIWQVYQNVLAAAIESETAYVACCEDDTLYSPSHFSHRPAPDVFAYDLSRWVLTVESNPKPRRTLFYWRERHQMAMLVCRRELLIDTLMERFAKHPAPLPHELAKKAGWGEPGRYEKNLGLPRREMAYFRARMPSVTFNHGESLMGRRRLNVTDTIAETLEPWGSGQSLWDRVHG